MEKSLLFGLCIVPFGTLTRQVINPVIVVIKVFYCTYNNTACDSRLQLLWSLLYIQQYQNRIKGSKIKKECHQGEHWFQIKKKKKENPTSYPNIHPVMPPFAPLALKRFKASCSVSQVIVVPRLLTRGRAKHWRPPLQGVKTNFPLTHWAKSLPMQALGVSAAV